MPRFAVLDVDLERSWLDSLRAGLDDALAIDEPGMLFRAKGRDRWVEPRMVAWNFSELDIRRRPWSDVSLQVRCFVKVEAKGERQLTLSEVVDEVRRVIDPRRVTSNSTAGVLRITDCDGQEVGILQCSPPSERRAYNQSQRIRGDQLEGLDVAILTVPCKLTSNVCG